MPEYSRSSEIVECSPTAHVEQTAESAIELSIVMPCLNEAETVKTCIRKAQAFLCRHQIAGEIVIGDNGSTDGSQDLARSCGARVVNVRIRGYGAALYQAIITARGKYIIMGDSDDSHDFTKLMPFVEKLREGYDLVMGNRFQGGIERGAMPWKNRYIGNPVLSGIGRMLFRCPSSDFHCGLRGCSAEAFRRMDLQTTGMEFASEMVIKSTLLRLNIAEVPTTSAIAGRSRPPHLRPWRDGWRHLQLMILYSPRWLFFYPGIAMMLVGLALGAWLLPQPRAVGNVVLDVHSMLYAAAAVMLGSQAALFGALGSAFAKMQGLRPSDDAGKQANRVLVPVWGSVFGGLLMAAGVLASAVAVSIWRKHSFGELDPSQMLRIAIPAVLSMVVGAQMVLASFFLSVMRVGLRSDNRTSHGNGHTKISD